MSFSAFACFSFKLISWTWLAGMAQLGSDETTNKQNTKLMVIIRIIIIIIITTNTTIA